MSAIGSVQDNSNHSDAGFAGRVAMLYALGRHYLSLPFAVLCVPATLIGGDKFALLPLVPLTLQMVGVIAAERLASAYKAHASEHDAHYWAWRYTFVSAIAGATWGIGVPFWFVWNSFPAQAYLTLALLGMTATEFIARSAHRPAYLAHASFALIPLVALLLWQGGLFPVMTAILVVLFVAVLTSYCNGIGKLLSESLHLRNENAALVLSLSREKAEAIAARDAAQAGAQAKAAFIANMSHELRTPMNSLLGMAQLLERAELPKQQLDHVKVMLAAGHGLQTLLDDVIALTRNSSQDDEEEDCDPIHCVRAITRLLQPRAWEKRLRLTMSAPASLPRVAADPRRLRQILLKLTENALKFTEQGGIELRVSGEAAPGTHQQDGHQQDGRQQVRFCVTDSGHGVAPHIAANLFKPFAPGDESYARKEQGPGLGLAVARRIVEQAGGTIGFESVLGHGATFWFTLPAVGAGPVQSQPAEAVAACTPPSRLKLLLFTHAPDVREWLSDLLEPFGNRLASARTVTQTMTRGAREHFDAIIADAADTDQIAASPGIKAPVIALALHGERAPDGAADILRSPLSAEALYDVLGKIAPTPQHPENAQDMQGEMPASIDPAAFATLEQSVGLPTLIEILQCYIGTAEELTAALAEACAAENWTEAAKLAQDIVGAAGGLGFLAITQAARSFAQKAREGEDGHALRNAAQIVVGEHVRARKALGRLYPCLAA
jgi:signal transduction histidine kinase/HPt (histidine-containing phosphotransfer) domain-containing protein